MDETFPAPARQDPYRTGYREGFGDGFTQADRVGRDAQKEPKDGDAGTAPDDKKDEDEDQGDAGDEKAGDESKDEPRGEPDGKVGADKTPLYRRPVLVGVALLVLALIIAAIVFWRHSKHHESTDDAFIDGLTGQVAAQAAGRVVKL